MVKDKGVIRMHERLLAHCMENSIITDKQAAYLKGDSTTHQLLYIVHTIRTNWANHKLTQGLFDKVWHKALIAKLHQIGVDGHFLDTI